jgi:hypothetical protein
LRAFPLVSEGLAALCHQLTSEVLFGGEGVVRRAAQSEVSSQMWAVPGERLEVVELQATDLGAAFTARIHVRTAAAIAPIDLAAHGGGDVAAPSRCGAALCGGAALARWCGGNSRVSFAALAWWCGGNSRVSFAALARCRFGFARSCTALARCGVRVCVSFSAALAGRRIHDGKFALLQGCDQQLHGFEVKLAETHAWSFAR